MTLNRAEVKQLLHHEKNDPCKQYGLEKAQKVTEKIDKFVNDLAACQFSGDDILDKDPDPSLELGENGKMSIERSG